MKALIPTGGAGTRLRPITHTSAKQLVPVGNKPILFYCLEAMAKAGITEVGLVVGDTKDEIRAAVGDGSAWGLTCTYIEQDRPAGLAHCVLISREFLGDDDFVMYLGDNLLRQGIVEFVRRFEEARAELAGAAAAQILLAHVPDPHRFGVAELDANGEVVRLIEKPPDPPSDLALVGVYLFSPLIHEAVDSIQPSARGELEITDAIQWLIDNGYRVRKEVVEGYWKDLGKLDALLEGNRLILEAIESRIDGTVDEASLIEGRVVVEAGAVVERSTVRGPSVIGAGARVVDSYIGPFSAIGDGCVVLRSEVENSVILEQCRIEGVDRLEGSLLGKAVEVVKGESRPRATKLMVGEHSRVEL